MDRRMSLFDRLFRREDPRGRLRPLYGAIVALGRDEGWYREAGVPDSVDGRFEAIALMLALVLLRMEREPALAADAALLTEWFVVDMDGQLRQIGIGDVVVGKQIGKMMSALGGRLGALRDALATDAEPGALAAALGRNLYRGGDVAAPTLAVAAARTRAAASALDGLDAARLRAGDLDAVPAAWARLA